MIPGREEEAEIACIFFISCLKYERITSDQYMPRLLESTTDNNGRFICDLIPLPVLVDVEFWA